MKQLLLASLVLGGCTATSIDKASDSVSGAVARGAEWATAAAVKGTAHAGMAALDIAGLSLPEDPTEEQEDRAFAFCTANPCMTGCPALLQKSIGFLPECAPAADPVPVLAPPVQRAPPPVLERTPPPVLERTPSFRVSAGNDPLTSAPRPPRLRQLLRAQEGLVLVPRNGHICYGHWIKPGEFFGAMTIAQCETLLDKDIEQARTESFRVFGVATDAHVELCFWKRCADFRNVEDLPLAVASNERMLSINRGRTLRLARALRDQTGYRQRTPHLLTSPPVNTQTHRGLR